MVRTDEDPFRQPPRGRAAAATSPEGGGKGEVRIRLRRVRKADCRAGRIVMRRYGGDGQFFAAAIHESPAMLRGRESPGGLPE